MRHIGNKFINTDDNLCFIICDVVERAEDQQMFFKYTKELPDVLNVQKGEDHVPPMNTSKRRRTIYEYTPCEELLSADWVEWTDVLL